jgi:hypothetical protein
MKYPIHSERFDQNTGGTTLYFVLRGYIFLTSHTLAVSLILHIVVISQAKFLKNLLLMFDVEEYLIPRFSLPA